MKNKIAALAAGAALLMAAIPTFAGAKNATLIEWTWPAGIDKSAHFQTTGSGLVNAWTYDHPDLDDARFIFKPLSKFKNATECDEGWVRENPSWTAQGIWNTANLANRELIEGIFPNLSAQYLFCAYPMD